MGANFVLQKPISQLNAARCFHAALNFMLNERRRYFRQPVKMQIKLVLDGKTLNSTSTNISEGGIAIKLREALPKGAEPRVKFTLPGTTDVLDLESEVAWADVKGLAGLRFRNIPKSSQVLLESWLDARIEAEFPGSKERFAAARASKS